MERFNCHRSVTPAPHFVACPQSAVIYLHSQHPILMSISMKASRHTTVTWVGDAQRRDTEIFSAGGAKFNVVASVVVNAGLCQHCIVLNFTLPINNTTKFFITVHIHSCHASTLSLSRLRNDLYCVQWDVKLYSTIPYSLSIHCNGHFPGVSWYQNVTILDFIAAKDDGDGGDNWSYKTCKAPVKSSSQSNQLHIKYLAFNHYSTTLSATLAVACQLLLRGGAYIQNTDIQYWYCKGPIWCQISPLSVYQVTPVS